jgi:hypothetical protein
VNLPYYFRQNGALPFAYASQPSAAGHAKVVPKSILETTELAVENILPFGSK